MHVSQILQRSTKTNTQKNPVYAWYDMYVLRIRIILQVCNYYMQ